MFPRRPARFTSRSRLTAGVSAKTRGAGDAGARTRIATYVTPESADVVRPTVAASRVPAARTATTSSGDVVLLRTFVAWIFLQFFYYDALPFLRLSVGLTLTPDRLAFLVIVILVGVRLLASQAKTAPIIPTVSVVRRSAALFAAVALTSWMLNGSDAGNARFGALMWITNLALYPAFAFFVATRLRYTRAMLNELIVCCAAFGAYLGVTAVAEHYEVRALIFPGYILDPGVGMHFGRSRGPFVDAISDGGTLLLGLLASTALAASNVGIRRLGALFLALLVVVAVYFTETRGVWLAFAVVLGTLLVLNTGHRSGATAILCVLGIAFVLGVGSKFSVFDQSLFSRRQRTIDYRLDNYEIVWNAFKANPVFGLGYGKLWFKWYEFFDSRHSRLTEGMETGNHSTVLGLLAELGLVGTIPYVVMLAGAALLCVRSYRMLEGPEAAFERQFAVIAICTLEIVAVLGLTNDLKAMPVVNITAFWFVGALGSVAAAQASREGSDIEGRSSGRTWSRGWVSRRRSGRRPGLSQEPRSE